MPRRVSPMLYQLVLEEHRRRLARVIDQRGAAGVKRLYDAAAAELVRRLAVIAPAGGASFELHHRRLVLAQLLQGVKLLAKRLHGELGDLTREAQRESIRSVEQMIVRLEGEYAGVTPVLPTAEAMRFAGLVDRRRTSLLRAFPKGTENRIEKQGVAEVTERMGMSQRQATSAANLASRMITRCEQELALSTLQAEPAAQTIDRIGDVIDGQWYEAERIVRTEGAWASNGAASDAIEAATEVLPSMQQRWCEHVDEGSLTPLDDRVDVDSIAMHAQVAQAGGLFTMPATAPRGTLKAPSKVEVRPELVGRSWEHPPDRPNDRAVIAPWRPEWGLPGWRYDAGARVPLV